MKYIKLFESFDKSDTEELLEFYGIENYIINPDGTVDVNGDVDLDDLNIDSIDINFGTVDGYFSCSNNGLTNLEGCPKYVGENFICNDNLLTTLEGCPEYVGGDFQCRNGSLTNLKYSPSTIKGLFDCSENALTTLEGISDRLILKSYFDCSCNELTNLKYLPKAVMYRIDENKLPIEIINLGKWDTLRFWNMEEYGVWNDDGTFNDKRYDILNKDILSGTII